MKMKKMRAYGGTGEPFESLFEWGRGLVVPLFTAAA
jgi:hypothetical protein